jgi:hypothetical protein
MTEASAQRRNASPGTCFARGSSFDVRIDTLLGLRRSVLRGGRQVNPAAPPTGPARQLAAFAPGCTSHDIARGAAVEASCGSQGELPAA